MLSACFSCEQIVAPEAAAAISLLHDENLAHFVVALHKPPQAAARLPALRDSFTDDFETLYGSFASFPSASR